MKNRKRFLCTVTAVLTAAGMLSGCSADSSGDGGAEYVTTNAGTVAVNSGGDADKTPAGEAADPNAGRWDNSGVLQHADGGASDGGIVVTEYGRGSSGGRYLPYWKYRRCGRVDRVLLQLSGILQYRGVQQHCGKRLQVRGGKSPVNLFY